MTYINFMLIKSVTSIKHIIIFKQTFQRETLKIDLEKRGERNDKKDNFDILMHKQWHANK